MIFNQATHTRLLITMTLDIDPTGSTVEVAVDDTWHPATWQDTPVQTGERWTQVARTVDYFAGPTATPGTGDIVLSVGRHRTRTRVTKGPDVLAANSSVIDVQ